MRIDRALPLDTAAHEGVRTLRRAAAHLVQEVAPLLSRGRREDFLAAVVTLSTGWESLVSPPASEVAPEAVRTPPEPPEESGHTQAPPKAARRSTGRQARRKAK
jgi:hypothetical protein